MKHVAFFGVAVSLIAGLCVAANNAPSPGQKGPQSTPTRPEGSPNRKDKVLKTDAEWKKILSAEQYRILRHGGTEAPFCTKFHDNHLEGSYYCAGCKLEIFRSKDKFDSGTGWPSFSQAADKDSIWTRVDTSWRGIPRTELLCARCDGHLGHVFEDGPKPTGMRHCINSASLLFKRKGGQKFETP